MRILIPRLPQSTTRGELYRFVSGILAKKTHLPFTEQPEISACRIVRIRDSRGVIEYFGLLEVTPDKAGHWLLSHFRRQRIHNKRVFARPFKTRGLEDFTRLPEDDRRRPDLKIEAVLPVEVQTRGLGQFAGAHH